MNIFLLCYNTVNISVQWEMCVWNVILHYLVYNLIKDRTVPEPTVKMVLPIKHDVIEVNNDGVRSLLAEFMYGWLLHNRTDMVLVADYEDTRYYYNLQFYRD